MSEAVVKHKILQHLQSKTDLTTKCFTTPHSKDVFDKAIQEGIKDPQRWYPEPHTHQRQVVIHH